MSAARNPPDLSVGRFKDYRLTVKIRNNRLLRAIESVGGTPGSKWCEANGLRYSRVNDLINMTSSPLAADGNLYPDAERLCEILDKLPEDLWSNEQLRPFEKNFSEMEMDHAQVLALLPSEDRSYLPDNSVFEAEQTKLLISKALDTLNGREREVIRLRYEEELTFEEIGKRFNVSYERIRQIEASALRKLRHPSMIGMFVDCLDVEEPKRAFYKKAAQEYLDEKAAKW